MQIAPTRISPVHLLLAAIATGAAIIAAVMLLSGQDVTAVCCVAVTLTAANFIATDVRNRSTRHHITELRGEVRELAALARQHDRKLDDMNTQVKKNTLGITETHRLEGQAVQILTEISGDPTGPQPIHPDIRRVQ